MAPALRAAEILPLASAGADRLRRAQGDFGNNPAASEDAAMPSTILAPGGLGKLLGITVPYAAKRRVIAQLEIEPQYLTEHGAVDSSVVVALADYANTHAAMLNATSGRSTATIESKSHFLSPGRGNTLRAEATPVLIGNGISIWRAAVFREDEQIAEVTQTQVVAGEATAASHRDDGEPPRRRALGEGPLSD